MKQRIIPALLVLTLVVAGAVYLARRWNGSGGDRLAFSGNIELTEVKISFKTAGRLAELLVKEGDRVSRGMVIARLDRDQLLNQRDAQRATLAAAQSQLAQVLTGVDYQRETVEGTLAASHADVAQSDARLRELLAGSRSQEIQEGSMRYREAGPGIQRWIRTDALQERRHLDSPATRQPLRA
jgi:HlyD family secretion protein